MIRRWIEVVGKTSASPYKFVLASFLPGTFCKDSLLPRLGWWLASRKPGVQSCGHDVPDTVVEVYEDQLWVPFGPCGELFVLHLCLFMFTSFTITSTVWRQLCSCPRRSEGERSQVTTLIVPSPPMCLHGWSVGRHFDDIVKLPRFVRHPLARCH